MTKHFRTKMMENPNTNSLRVAFGTGLNRHRGLSQRMSRVYFYINSNIHQLGYVKNPTFSQLWPQNLRSQTLKVRCFQSQHIQKTCEGIGALGVFAGLEFQYKNEYVMILMGNKGCPHKANHHHQANPCHSLSQNQGFFAHTSLK